MASLSRGNEIIVEFPWPGGFAHPHDPLLVTFNPLMAKGFPTLKDAEEYAESFAREGFIFHYRCALVASFDQASAESQDSR
jgi:hypothetical protein